MFKISQSSRKMKNIFKRIRMFFLLFFVYKFNKKGKQFYIGKNLFIRPNTVSIGNYVFIGSNSHLSVKKLYIDDFTMLASYVSIVGGDHNFESVGIPMILNQRSIEKEVVIKKDVWIGHGVIILHGVTIGEGSIIGAGSIVTKDIEPYSIVAGNPATFIRKRFASEEERVKHSQKINRIYNKKR